MRVKLVNRYGEVLILPEELSLKGWPDDTNLKGTEIEGRPGRIIDRPNSKLRPRIIRVAGYMAGIDKDDADKIREMIAGFVNEAGPFKIYRHDTADRYMSVYKKSMDHEYKTGHFEGKVFSLSLSFEAADPFFYSDEVTEEFYVTGDSVKVSAVSPNLPGTNGLVDVEYVGTGWYVGYWFTINDCYACKSNNDYVKVTFYGTGISINAIGSYGIMLQLDNGEVEEIPPNGGQEWKPYTKANLAPGKHECVIWKRPAVSILAINSFDILGSNLYLLDNPGTAESEPVIYVEPAEREESFDYKGKVAGSLTENKHKAFNGGSTSYLTPSQAGWGEFATGYIAISNKDNVSSLTVANTPNMYTLNRFEYDLSHLSPAYLNSLVYKGFHKAQGSNAGVKDYTYKVQAWDTVGQKYDDLGTGGLMFERSSEALKTDGTFASKHEPRFDHGGTKNLLPATATKFDWKHTGFSYYDEIVGVPENCANGKASVGLRGLIYTNIFGSGGSVEKLYPANTTVNASIATIPKLPIGKYILIYNITATSGTSTRNTPWAEYTDSTKIYEKTAENYNTTLGRKIWKINATKEIGYIGWWCHSPAVDVKIKDFMLIAVDDTEYAKTDAELLAKYSYVNGTKSTVSAVRMKAVGKNLFDGKIEIGDIGTNTGLKVNIPERSRTINYTKIKPNTSYYCGKEFHTVFWYDWDYNFILGVDISQTLGSRIVSPSNAFYFKARKLNTDLATKWQVEEGSIATSYEPYVESNLYLNAGQELRSLPNETKDEVNAGQLSKRIDKTFLKASDIVSMETRYLNIDYAKIKQPPLWKYASNVQGAVGSAMLEGYPEKVADYDNANHIGKVDFQPSNDYIWAGFAKGTTIEQARTALTGKALIYQLAQPEVLPIESEGSLTAYQNGTLYAELSLWGYIEAGNSTKTITDITLPAGYIRKVERIDIVDGKEVRIDVTADCTLTNLNTVITINNPDLTKRYFYDCSIAEGYSTNGEKTYFFEKAVTLTQGQVVAELEAVNATKVELVKGTDDIIYYTTVTPDKPKLAHTASMYVKNIGTVPVVIGSQTIQPGTHTRATVSIPANTTEAKLAIKTTPETVPGTKLALMAWHPQIEEGATATEWVEGRSTGILIEEGTTNLLEGRTDFQKFWVAYFGATATVTEGQNDPYGGTGAYRVQTNGGSGLEKYLANLGPKEKGKVHSGMVWIKNNGISNVKLYLNQGGEGVIVTPKSGYILAKSEGLVCNGSSYLQMQFQAQNVSDNLDITVFQPQIEEKAYCTSYTPTSRQPESLTIPARGVLPMEGSMEVEFTLSQSGNTSKEILRISNNNFRLGIQSTKNIYLRVNDKVQQLPPVTIGKHTIRANWNKQGIKIFIDGVQYIDDKTDSSILNTNELLKIGSYSPDLLFYNDPIHYLHFTTNQWTDAEMASPDRLPVDGDTTFVKDFSEENLDCITPFEATITSPQKYIDAEGKVNFLVRSSFPADANIPSYVYTDYVQMKANYQQATLGANAVVLKARNLGENMSFEEVVNGEPIGWGKTNKVSLYYADTKEGKVAIKTKRDNYYSKNFKVIPDKYYRIGAWVKATIAGVPLSPFVVEFKTVNNENIIYVRPYDYIATDKYTWEELITKAPANADFMVLYAGQIKPGQPDLISDGYVIECLGDSPESPTRQGYVEPLRKYLSFSSPVVLAKGEVLSYSNTSQMRVQKNGESVLNQASTEMLLGSFPIQTGKQILEFNCPKDELWKVTLKYQPKYY